MRKDVASSSGRLHLAGDFIDEIFFDLHRLAFGVRAAWNFPAESGKDVFQFLKCAQMSPASFAAATISPAMGAAAVPPYWPCSTRMANAMRFPAAPSPGAKPI